MIPSQKSIFSSVVDAFSRAAEWTLNGPVGQLIGVDARVFAENVAVSVVSGLIIACAVSFAGIFASRALWRFLTLRFKAATIRKAAGRGFVLVLCPIENDTNEAIANEIAARVEVAFRAFIGGLGSRRPFEVIKFPLRLPGDEGTAQFDRSMDRAKHWLARTNGEILVWGKHIKNDSVGTVRIVGKDYRSKLIESRRIDFDNGADQFDDALSNAIAFEMASIKSNVLQEPETIKLKILRPLIEKFDRLASHDAPALSEGWRERMGKERDRLKRELLRGSSQLEELLGLETEARSRLSALDPKVPEDALAWADAALEIGIATRKRAFHDSNLDELMEADDWLSQAIPIFEAKGDKKLANAAEAALERSLLFRYASEFNQLTDSTKTQYGELLVTALKLASTSGAPHIVVRMNAWKMLADITSRKGKDDKFFKTFGFSMINPQKALDAIKTFSLSLRGSERAEWSALLGIAIFNYGPFDDERYRKAGIAAIDMVAGFGFWTDAERLYLKAQTVALCGDHAQILSALNKHEEERTSLYTLCGAFGREVLDHWEHFGEKRLSRLQYISLRQATKVLQIPAVFGNDASLATRIQTILRRLLKEAESRFHADVRDQCDILIVALNNSASVFDDVESATKAYQRAQQFVQSEMIADEGNAYNYHLHRARYTFAFAAWQIARLTPEKESVQRQQRGKEAHELGCAAWNEGTNLNQSPNLSEQLTICSAACHQLLREIEATFPSLALDLDAAALAADKD